MPHVKKARRPRGEAGERRRRKPAAQAVEIERKHGGKLILGEPPPALSALHVKADHRRPISPLGRPAS